MCDRKGAEKLKIARFEVQGRAVYGVVEGDSIREVEGSIFDGLLLGDREKGDGNLILNLI